MNLEGMVPRAEGGARCFERFGDEVTSYFCDRPQGHAGPHRREVETESFRVEVSWAVDYRLPAPVR